MAVVKYFNKVRINHIHIDQGKDSDGKNRPPKVISFRNHHFTTADPEVQKMIEEHPLFGTRIRVVSRDHKAPGATKYADGVATTAHKPVETALPTGQERAALRRAQAKIDEDLPLTEKEQAAYDKFGDLEV